MGMGRVVKILLIRPILMVIAMIVYLVLFEIKLIKGEVKLGDLIKEVMVKAKDWVTEKLRSTL